LPQRTAPRLDPRTQIVVHVIDNLLPRASRWPCAIAPAACAHLGYDDQFIGIRVERLLDNLIGYMRAVEVAGIYVVHSSGDGFAQNSDRIRI